MIRKVGQLILIQTSFQVGFSYINIVPIHSNVLKYDLVSPDIKYEISPWPVAVTQ